jgi:hypothetical protein
MYKLTATLLILLTAFSCVDEPVEDAGPCGEKISLRMFVVDTLDKPKFFKTSKTFLNDTMLILKYEELSKPAALVVITDDEIDKISYSINELTVKAYDFKDSLLLQVQYLVSRDSCHVRYIEGPKKIIIR